MAKLVFLVLVLVGGIVHASAAAASRQEPVSYPSGNIGLAALLLLPESAGPHPAVVIVQGSGESDRTNLWARSIAETLAEAGFAVLLTDKRGSGASGGDWRIVGFDVLAADALAGVSFLSSRADIDQSRIGLVGLSQGGRIVPIAAAQSDAVAFVLNLAGDAVSFAEQSAHEMGNIARQAGLPEPMQQEVLRLNRAAGRAMLTGDWNEYRRLRESGSASPWAPIAQGFPEADDPVWTFYREVIDFDPMPYWTLVRQPALILYGEEDEQDNVAVAESVRRLRFGFRQSGKANYEIVILSGVGHSLGWTRSAGLGEEAKATIHRWLRENVESVR